ncbi:MAG: diguanylate cyclase domain-containing protein [Bryobacteraceae bacterium]
MLLVVSLAGCARAPHVSVLTSVSQVRQLTAGQAGLGVPVRIKAILTYFDGTSSYCFLQDASGGIRVGLAAGQIPPDSGWRVEVTGLVSSGGTAPAIVEGRLSPLRPDGLPPPVPVSAARLRDPQYEYRRVAVSGVVQSVSSERPGIVNLEIRTGGAIVWGTVPASLVVINDEWTDADVIASGVLAEPLDGDPHGNSSGLWISDTGSIETIHNAKPALQLPVSTAKSLLALDPAAATAHRVRIRGRLRERPGAQVAIADETGQIPLRLAQAAPAADLGTTDVVGFLAWESGHLVLNHAEPLTAAQDEDPRSTPAPGHPITTALQVHALTQAAALRGYPVHLRAVVTFHDPFNHLLFVQDRTDGMFVALDEKEKTLPRAGDEVEVTGVTTADFAPDVTKARIQVLGHPGLPKAKVSSLGNASWGREDCRWIELEGTVQRVAPGRGDSLLTIGWGRSTYKAHVLAPAASLAPLVDAEVRVQGVCGALFNGRRQLLGIQMFAPGAECIRVVRTPSPDPYSMPPTPISDLMKFSSASVLGHRVRVRGTVTYPSLTGPTWVRDATGGVMIRDHQSEALAAGDLVDVVGFPEIDGFSPVLRGAQVRRAQSGSPPVSRQVTAQDALKGDFDGQLVQIDGKLIDRLQQPAEEVLAVASGGVVFTAHLRGARVNALEPGTQLRLTGICAVETQQSQDLIVPRTFRLLLRSAADVGILGRPPLLTADRVAPVLAGAALVIVAALAWAALLRRRVRAQTQALRAQTVQLQAAHQRTRDALRKACEAESLDEDSNRILELIARDEPVELIVDHIAEAVASHCEGAVCAILLDDPPGARVCVVPAMPSHWMQALGRVDVRSLAYCSDAGPARDFSRDPSWAKFIDSQPHARFRGFCCAPISVDGATAGAIAAFFRDDKRTPDPAGGQLALWCNIVALALERRRLHDQLSYRAQHDGLTGLPNRASLADKLPAEVACAAGAGGLLGMLYIDLDGFKQINDTYGHDAGDLVLQEASRRMSRAVRRGDTVARVGGDEFVILLSIGRREDAQLIAEKLSAALREPIVSGGQRFSVSACIGIGVWPLDGDQPDAVLRFADRQMYEQKKTRLVLSGAGSQPAAAS